MQQTRNNHRIEDFIVLSALYIFLFTEVSTGLIRYILTSASLEYMIYVPKAILVVIVIYKIFNFILQRRASRVFFISLLLIFLQIVVGFIYVTKTVQIFFGLWVIFPLLFGIAIYKNVSQNWERLTYKPILVIWLIAVVSIFLQVVVSYPWEGLSFSVGSISINASKLWWIHGVQRLSGVSRASTQAAASIGLLSILLVYKTRPQYHWLIIILGSIAIWLTTSRSWLLAWTVLIVLQVGNKYIAGKIKRIIPLAFSAIGILLPIASYFANFTPDKSSYFYSLGQRLDLTWPGAFELIFSYGNILFGRGLGGIGTPQVYFETALNNPADNINLSIYALFGLLGVLIFLIFSFNLGNLPTKRGFGFSKFVYFVSIALLIHGFSANSLESSLESLTLGLCLGNVFGGFPNDPN